MIFSFSVIIPTYNRPQSLQKCLEALSKLSYEAFEVIVVDDGSSQSLQTIIAPFQSQLQITLIEQKNEGPAAARNRGASVAKGDFFAFTDDDCLPDSGWLTALGEGLKANPDDLVGGKTLNALPRNPYASTSQGIIDVVYSYYHTGSKPLRFFAANNFAISRTVFNHLEGFNATFRTSEDRELCDRALQLGYEMTYIPKAVIHHAHDLNLNSFWQQHFSYGRGAYRFYQSRMERGLENLKVEPQFYQQLLSYPLRAGLSTNLRLFYPLFLFVAQLANLWGFLIELNTTYQVDSLQLQSQDQST